MKKLFVLMALVMIFGCRPEALPELTPLPPQTEPVATEEPTPTPQELASPTPEGRRAEFPNTIIVYQAGTSEELKLTIYHTGRIVRGDGVEWQVPASDVEPLFDLVESPPFREVEGNYAASDCQDCVTGMLTVYNQEDVTEITIQAGSEPPDILGQVMDLLDALSSGP